MNKNGLDFTFILKEMSVEGPINGVVQVKKSGFGSK